MLSRRNLDGRRRYLACNRVGVQPEFKDVSHVANPVAYSWSKNGPRRHLSISEKAMVAAHVRKLFVDEEAKERQRQSQGRGKKGQANLPDLKSDAGQSRDKAAELVGVSGRSVDHATRVLKHGTPKLVAAVETGNLAVSAAGRPRRLPAQAMRPWSNRGTIASAIEPGQLA